MMLLDLICFDCVLEQINKGLPKSTGGEAILTPCEQVNNSGIYTVNCSKGHSSKTIIDNIDFEILFDYGINAIADGYYRESASSLTSSMERYFDFFIKVVLRASNIDFPNIDRIWKNISSQSERQLGAYIILYSQTFGEEPLLLNQNKEVPFRNSVIHKGYIPSKTEALEFGNTVMKIIEKSLIKLKSKYESTTFEVFDYYGYQRIAEEQFDKIAQETGEEQNFACVNIMTTISVKHGRENDIEDVRNGNLEQCVLRFTEQRQSTNLLLFMGNSEDL